MADPQITVRKGDSIWKIAKRVKPAGVSTDAFVKQMIAANPELADPDKIKPGMVLKAPGAKEPPTPRMDPRGVPGERGHQAPRSREIRGGAPPNQESIIEGGAPADIQRGVEPVVNEVVVDRTGEIRARAGTEQFGPAGSPGDRQAAMVEIARRAELTRRAAIQQGSGAVADALKARGLGNVVESQADPTAGRPPDPGQGPTPLEGGPLLQRSPKTDYPREAAVPLPRPKDIYLAQAMKFASAGDRGNYTLGDPAGLLEEGTVNLADRPRIPRPDGTYYSMRAKSFPVGGREVLVPIIDPDGNGLSDKTAVERFVATGEHLGVFKDADSATAYAKRLGLGLGGPTHDPDAFIDPGSPRWIGIFNATMDAMEGTATRRKVRSMPVPTAAAKVRTPVTPTPQSLNTMNSFMTTASGVGSMGGKK